jgi:hypothetical protein
VRRWVVGWNADHVELVALVDGEGDDAPDDVDALHATGAHRRPSMGPDGR